MRPCAASVWGLASDIDRVTESLRCWRRVWQGSTKVTTQGWRNFESLDGWTGSNGQCQRTSTRAGRYACPNTDHERNCQAYKERRGARNAQVQTFPLPMLAGCATLAMLLDISTVPQTTTKTRLWHGAMDAGMSSNLYLSELAVKDMGPFGSLHHACVKNLGSVKRKMECPEATLV